MTLVIYRTHRMSIAIMLMLFFISLSARANYTIEMIVFESTNPTLWLSENWPLLPAALDTDNNDVLVTSGSNGRQWFGDNQLQLRDVAKRLVSSGEYRILSHLAWSQPIDTKESAKTTTLPEGLSNNGLPLQAQLTLYKQKFEHLSLTMQCERKIPETVIGAFAQKQNLSVAELGTTWRFRLQENRKIKLNELQYFDHPMCGVLLSVRTP